MARQLLIFFITLVCCVSTATAERFKNSLSGQIIAQTTHAPVDYVNIFLANTTIGTTSNKEGHYVIQDIPPGNYTLVLSYIGYETITQKVQINETSKAILNFALKPTVIEMSPIQIDEFHDRQWRKHFKLFKEEFLGYSDNADACDFTNPEVLRLLEDEEAKTLQGKTIQPLELIHANFGYRISLIVRSFLLTNDNVTYSVLPVFYEMTPESDEQAREWQENRKKAFYGSYRHFFYTLFNGQFRQAGFSIEQVEETKRFRSSEQQYDSNAAAGQLFSHTDYGLLKRIHFSDYLRIRYNENWAQTSFLKLPFDTMEIDLSGNAFSEFQIIRSGHWGETRFADELPLDYRPQ